GADHHPAANGEAAGACPAARGDAEPAVNVGFPGQAASGAPPSVAERACRTKPPGACAVASAASAVAVTPDGRGPASAPAAGTRRHVETARTSSSSVNADVTASRTAATGAPRAVRLRAM